MSKTDSARIELIIRNQLALMQVVYLLAHESLPVTKLSLENLKKCIEGTLRVLEA